MTAGKHKSESKRKLFHAITSRIPHFNYTTQHQSNLEHSNSEDVSNSITAALNNKTDTNSDLNVNSGEQRQNIQTGVGLLGKQSNLTLNIGILHQHQAQNYQQQSQLSTSLIGDSIGSISKDNVTNPVTQGSDNSNFSYLESVKKAPSKKKYRNSSRPDAITPTYTFKNKAPEIRGDSGTIGNLKFGFSPAESSANSEVSFTGKTDSLIINDSFKGDMNEYDYRTFGTKHPFRLSKVRAFEQSELTTKSYFSITKNKTPSRQVNKENIVLQIPNLSQEATRQLLSYETVENRVSENTSYKRRNVASTEATKLPLSGVERRIYMMKNALAPLSSEELILNKLQASQLSQVFQRNGDFLQNLNQDEIEYWEVMNEEFEEGMQNLRKKHYRDACELNSLIDSETLHAIKSAMKYRTNKGPRKRELGDTLSTLVRKRVKETLDEERSSVLNTNL